MTMSTLLACEQRTVTDTCVRRGDHSTGTDDEVELVEDRLKPGTKSCRSRCRRRSFKL